MAEMSYKYGVPFKPPEFDGLGEVAVAYMAQSPNTTLWKWPSVTIPAATPAGNPGETVYSTTPDDLEALLTAIFALKGSTAEIFKLKALAFSIKAKLANDGQ